MAAKIQIEPVALADEAAVRAFLVKSIERPGAAAGMPDGWLAWLSRGAECAGVADIPVGWKLVSEGELGGVHLVVPFRVAAEGGEAISIQSAGFYVDPRWHGPASGALFMALVKHRSRFHCSVGTANEASAAVWKAFRAEQNPGSGEEFCVMSAHPSLLEEALVRRMSWLTKLLPKSAPGVRASLPRRLASLREALRTAVTEHGAEAVESCAALPFSGAGALPTAELLRWKLSAPDPRHTLLALTHQGAGCAAFFTAATRGHRAQAATLSVSAVWGPAWDADAGGVLEMILTAARKEFPFITVGFSPIPEAAGVLLRRRSLDAPRRWLAKSPAQPAPLPGWNGLDAL